MLNDGLNDPTIQSPTTNLVSDGNGNTTSGFSCHIEAPTRVLSGQHAPTKQTSQSVFNLLINKLIQQIVEFSSTISRHWRGIPMSAIQRFHEVANDALVRISNNLWDDAKLALVIYTPGQPGKDIVLKDQELDHDEVLSTLRRSGLSIDGENAYKRDLIDTIIGALAFGKQNTNPPPSGHWGQQFWDIGRAEGEEKEQLQRQLAEAQALLRNANNLADQWAEKNALLSATAQPSSPELDMDAEREAFEVWADEKGFCLDCEFFAEGNNYENDDTRLAFDIWLARAGLPADGVNSDE